MPIRVGKYLTSFQKRTFTVLLKHLENWLHKYGNRRNRHKARMRYVFYKYGTEEAKRLYLEEFEALKKDPSIDFVAPALPLEHHKPSFSPLGERKKVIMQVLTLTVRLSKPGNVATPTSKPIRKV